jgi:hypothetical protein
MYVRASTLKMEQFILIGAESKVVASDGDDTCSFAHAFIYSFICAFKKYV